MTPHMRAAALAEVAHSAFLDMSQTTTAAQVMAVPDEELRQVLHSLAILAGLLGAGLPNLERRLVIDGHAAYVSKETKNV